MLISCAASGVAETMKAATEAATVVTRPRQPHFDVISFCLPAGPTNSPSPVRVCRKALCLLCRLPWPWLRRGPVLPRPGERGGAAGEAGPKRRRLPPRLEVRATAQAQRAPVCPPLLACVMPLRAVAPFRQGFDRRPQAPRPVAAPAYAAPDDARDALRPAPIAAVPADGCAAAAA